MSEKIEGQLLKTSNFFQTIWGTLTIIGTIVGGVIGGYWWLQDSIVERNAKTISTVAIEQIAAELDPMPRAEYMALRSRDSLERLHAEAIALRYMNHSDSIALVILSEMAEVDRISRKLDRIETRLDVDQMGKVDDQLGRIWKHLQERETNDSLLRNISSRMDEIREANKQKIDQVKQGDRIR